MLVVLLFKYFTGLNLGVKKIARFIKSICQTSGGIKKLFKRRRKTYTAKWYLKAPQSEINSKTFIL
ncbi:hypothetical protein M164_0922 [Sulfolobus islandicus M.16.4]|uniref:Uncharacterized protein n=1 Tax=Saccharolobus islandicus (strain M.16.4 / Kamchatka \|nr:hypothetical protein M164_0922 [Sulfolobus islandicus M.16.4]